MRGKRTKKGFSLMELLVVMAVIAILVLLVVPMFGGYTGDAKLSVIKNDTKVVEESTEGYAIKNKTYPAYKDISGDINNYLNEGKLYDIKGKIVEASTLLEYTTFKLVSSEFVRGNVSTSLSGVFVVTNTGRVFYLNEPMDAPGAFTETPVITASTSSPTNSDVNVSITFPADSVLNEYKIGGGSWINYSSALTIVGNTTIYARATDTHGIFSDEAILVVSNIDKTAPAPPVITGSDGSATIEFSSDTDMGEYKIGSGGTWTEYTGPITITEADTVYARGTDEAGNTSSEVSLLVDVAGPVGPTCPTPESLGYTFDHTSGSITGYDKSSPDINIPSEFDVGGICYPVTTLTKLGFQNQQLTSVVIPDTVTTIAPGAFSYNWELVNITVDENNPNYKSVNNAIYTKDGTKLVAGTSVMAHNIEPSTTIIGEEAFMVMGLDGVTIPEGIITIENGAFKNSSSYTAGINDVVIPNSVVTIGWAAFDSAGVDSIILGTGLETINGYGLSRNNFSTVTIPESVTYIGNFGFAGNELVDLVIPSGITMIRNSAFAGNNLTSVTLPEGLTTIDTLAFANNDLATFTAPSTVTTINSEAFKTNQLTEFIIPGGVTLGGTTTDRHPIAPSFSSVYMDVSGGEGTYVADYQLGTWTKVVAASSPVKEIIARSRLTYALMTDGSLYAWGYNLDGQLGLGDFTRRFVPTKVDFFDSLKINKFKVSGASGQIFAIADDDNLYSWGWNGNGELGLGFTGDVNTPSKVTTLDGLTVVDVIPSHTFTIAVVADGTVYSNGRNDMGQLGIGNNTNSSVPVVVSGLTGKGVVEYLTGQYHTIALTNDNKAYVWGSNSDGALGLGNTTPTNSPTLNNNIDPSTIVEHFSDYDYNVLLNSSGEVYTWGENGAGQLGHGDLIYRSVPTKVAALNGISIEKVTGFRDTVFAIASNGDVYSWGSNSSGQLGIGNYTSQSTPTNISTLSGVGVSEIFGGVSAAYALTNSGEVYAWGNNTYGQLGINSTSYRNSPTKITAFDGMIVTDLITSGVHAIAITSTGDIYVWGDNADGELGLGDATQRLVPTLLNLEL